MRYATWGWMAQALATAVILAGPEAGHDVYTHTAPVPWWCGTTVPCTDCRRRYAR